MGDLHEDSTQIFENETRDRMPVLPKEYLLMKIGDFWINYIISKPVE